MSIEAPTIAALLTPLAPGAIAVIGVAGSRTDAILRDILRRPRDEQSPALAAGRPTLCRIVDGDAFLDDAVVVRLNGATGPRAELCTHGGVRIAQRLLQLLERCGAKIVTAKEFCETVAPVHPVEREVDEALLRSPSRRLTQWLLRQRTILPAFLDRINRMDAAERDAFIARSRVAIRLLRGLTIALIGPPNAGKSTLANRLIGRDRVITSDVPGTTRDWVSETALIQGWPVTLTDTAGIRETECAIETEAIQRGREQAHRADLVLIVLDASTPAIEQSANFERLTGMLPAESPRLIVLNKCDLTVDQSREPDASQRALTDPVGASFSGVMVGAGLPISALSGAGISALESKVGAYFGWDRLIDALPTGFLPSHIRPF